MIEFRIFKKHKPVVKKVNCKH